MNFLYLLEKIRVPGLNELMLGITTLGEETAFLVIALIIFWCIDKKVGYYILGVGFIGTIANQFLKLLFRIPRPWVLDPDFTILEQAREAASGYSFPSGHTQSAVGTFGSIAYATRNRKLRIACIVLPLLVGLSRMYIGVHTPLDVVVSIGIGAVLIFALRPVVLGKCDCGMPWLLAAMVLLAVGFLCFVKFFPFPADLDPHNYESGLKNAYTLLGALLGLVVVYFADRKWLDFTTKALWWQQIIKVATGLGLVLLVKSCTKGVLNGIFGEAVGRSVRYGLIVIVAGIVCPILYERVFRFGPKE